MLESHRRNEGELCEVNEATLNVLVVNIAPYNRGGWWNQCVNGPVSRSIVHVRRACTDLDVGRLPDRA